MEFALNFKVCENFLDHPKSLSDELARCMQVKNTLIFVSGDFR